MKTQKILPYKDCRECEAVYLDILKTKLMALFRKSKQHSQNVSVFLLPDVRKHISWANFFRHKNKF